MVHMLFYGNTMQLSKGGVSIFLRVGLILGDCGTVWTTMAVVIAICNNRCHGMRPFLQGDFSMQMYHLSEGLQDGVL